MKTLDFWFEFASTYSYPAAMRIEALAEAHQVRVRYRPFLLGPIFASQGLSGSPFTENPVKGRYMWRDLERTCALHGLPLTKPSVFPRGSILAARIALWAAEQPWLPRFVRAVYTANFRDDRDISQREVVSELLGELGQEPDAVIAAASDERVKQGLRDQTEAAQQLGLFGAPSFIVNGELFWGNDRLEQALASG